MVCDLSEGFYNEVWLFLYSEPFFAIPEPYHCISIVIITMALCNDTVSGP